MLALLASYEKDANLLRLGKLLKDKGWALWGSAGTAKFLNDNGISCHDVAEKVGPPILAHRVVTLSREIHAALLASTQADFEELKRLGVEPIDLVYVTLYPLEQTLSDPAATENEIIDKTDIGGPTLLRSAAKGRRLALSSSVQIDLIEAWLKSGSPESEREKLAIKFAAAAERRVTNYVGASASYWESKIP